MQLSSLFRTDLSGNRFCLGLHKPTMDVDHRKKEMMVNLIRFTIEHLRHVLSKFGETAGLEELKRKKPFIEKISELYDEGDESRKSVIANCVTDYWQQVVYPKQFGRNFDDPRVTRRANKQAATTPAAGNPPSVSVSRTEVPREIAAEEASRNSTEQVFAGYTTTPFGGTSANNGPRGPPSNVRHSVAPMLAFMNAKRRSVPEACLTKIAPLPFFEVKRALKPLMILDAEGTGTKFRAIAFPKPDTSLIDGYTRRKALPRFEILIRFCRNDPNAEQLDDFPAGLILKLNGRKVDLPPMFQKSKRQEPKRLACPIDLTKYCAQDGGSDPNWMVHVSWEDDAQFAVGIYLVRHISWKNMVEKVKSNRKGFDESKKWILEKLKSESAIVHETAVEISLTCPVSLKKMAIPVRSDSCQHYQSFDLETFVRMNEKRPMWKCPTCDCVVSPESLFVDGFMDEMIKFTKRKQIYSVTVNKNGEWKCESEKSGKQKKASTTRKKKNVDPELVDLTGDYDDTRTCTKRRKVITLD